MIWREDAANALRGGARLVLTYAPEGPVWTLEPGGVVEAEDARALIVELGLAPGNDSLFPDHLAQTWSAQGKRHPPPQDLGNVRARSDRRG